MINSSNNFNKPLTKNMTTLQTTNTFLNKKRRKFDYIHDQLLMMGLTIHGKK